MIDKLTVEPAYKGKSFVPSKTSSMVAQSAFIVHVPEAESYAAQLRGQFDPSARCGVPAHVTVLYPFMPPERIGDGVLQQVRSLVSTFAEFEFVLAKVDRFPRHGVPRAGTSQSIRCPHNGPGPAISRVPTVWRSARIRCPTSHGGAHGRVRAGPNRVTTSRRPSDSRCQRTLQRARAHRKLVGALAPVSFLPPRCRRRLTASAQSERLTPEVGDCPELMKEMSGSFVPTLPNWHSTHCAQFRIAMTPNPSHAAVKYRPEVDGLRALAVLPVILFHAGFATFKGGYVGVDVFFVISGYLITSIIVSDCETGRFSIAKFYERRVRRILPALLLVTIVCLPLAWLLMLPYEFKDFSTSVVAVSLFASNFLFWRQTDYFATSAEEKPLLHTWSLAVEEQYYLFFPVLFLVLWRLGRRRVAAEVIGLLALASLLLAQAGGNLAFDGRERGIGWDWWRQPGWAFFLAPSRAWELFAGALIALFPLRIEHLPRWLAETGAGVGLALVIVAIFSFDSATPTPSIYTLVPVAGTGLLIVFAHPVTAVGSVLARRWLVGIGLISYSAYLWHQPLLAFARIRGEPDPVTLAALCCATLGLAYLTWRYVESPFRDRRRIGAKTLYASAVVASGFAIGVGLIGYVSGGFRQRFDVPASVLQSIRQSDRKAECFNKNYLHTRPDWLCRLGDRPQAKPSFMLVGDSHALSLLPAFDRAAAETGEAGVFVSAKKCAPFLNVHLLDDNQQSADCARLSERVRRYVSENSIRKLILVARWTYYTDGGYIGSDFAYLGTGASRKRDRESSRAAFQKGLVQTVAAYRALGVDVHVLGQVPQQLHGAADAYHRSYSSDERRFADALRALSVPRHSHARLQSYVSGLFLRSHREGGIKFTPLDELFCDSQSCLLGEPGHSYYFDDDHLSVAGALKATQVVRALIGTEVHPAKSPAS